MRPLSAREKECLISAAQGKTERITAHCLGISEHTVHVYLRSAIRKLNSRNKVQAVVRALVTQQLFLEDFEKDNQFRQS